VEVNDKKDSPGTNGPLGERALHHRVEPVAGVAVAVAGWDGYFAGGGEERLGGQAA